MHDRLLDDCIQTPAYVWACAVVKARAQRLSSLGRGGPPGVYYSVKACSLIDIVAMLAAELDGLSVSSSFEARLARGVGGTRVPVHYVSPLLPADEVQGVLQRCDRVTVNSLGQLERFGPTIAANASLGVRVNPQLSWLDDRRCDPCRPDSKLGVPLQVLCEMADRRDDRLQGVTGLHFHSHCASASLVPWVRTLEHIESVLGDRLHRFGWMNIGGGYTFQDELAADALVQACQRLAATYGLQIVMEPGAGLVREAGFLVSTVQDIIAHGQDPIAVLDTTVGHWPEVFEYQFAPQVVGHCADAPHGYVLAGSSCLAGDLFGRYHFDEPLAVGSRVIFTGAGAYALSKAHRFNGLNLPAIYLLTDSGDMVLRKAFTYADYAAQWGAAAD